MKQFTSREIFGACIVPLVGFAFSLLEVYFDVIDQVSLILLLLCFVFAFRTFVLLGR
jgi:hypothetical protein